MASPDYYVPILKSKAGELWALKHANSKTAARLRPLVEVHNVPKAKGAFKKSLDAHLESVCKKLVSSWGTTRELYLDSRWLEKDWGYQAIDKLFEQARQAGLLVIPVVRPDIQALPASSVSKIVTNDCRGLMLRCKTSQLDGAVLAQLATSLGCKVDETDLLVDYQSRPMVIETDLLSLTNLKDWRRLVAASGVFPPSLAASPQQQWMPIARSGWSSWKVAATSGGLSRIPAFSDYSVRAPGEPASGGNPPVVMRYTTDDKWFVYLHGRLQDGDASNMFGICADLISKSEYSGATFSEGDKEIDLRGANTQAGPGGPGQWVQWAVSHHLELVVSQLPV